MNVRLHARVSGVVQGVGFRYFTRQLASGLGLTGWVRNIPDGTVELVAEGPRDRLEHLLDAFSEGPHGSSVRGVTSDWSEATGEFSDFGVRV